MSVPVTPDRNKGGIFVNLFSIVLKCNIFCALFSLAQNGWNAWKKTKKEKKRVIKNVKKMDAKIGIFIKTPTGKQLFMMFGQNDFIDAVKANIEARIGVPLKQQILYFHGKCLNNGKVIGECGITKDATVHLKMSLLGGGKDKKDEVVELLKDHLRNCGKCGTLGNQGCEDFVKVTNGLPIKKLEAIMDSLKKNSGKESKIKIFFRREIQKRTPEKLSLIDKYAPIQKKPGPLYSKLLNTSLELNEQQKRFVKKVEPPVLTRSAMILEKIAAKNQCILEKLVAKNQCQFKPPHSSLPHVPNPKLTIEEIEKNEMYKTFQKLHIDAEREQKERVRSKSLQRTREFQKADYDLTKQQHNVRFKEYEDVLDTLSQSSEDYTDEFKDANVFQMTAKRASNRSNLSPNPKRNKSDSPMSVESTKRLINPVTADSSRHTYVPKYNPLHTDDDIAGVYVNDEIITLKNWLAASNICAFITLLIRDNNKEDTVAFFNPNWYISLQENKEKTPTTEDLIDTFGINLTKTTKILFFPISIDNHWIVFQYKKLKSQLKYFDPKTSQNDKITWQQYRNNIQLCIQDITWALFKQNVDEALTCSEFGNTQAPADNINCGIHVLKFIQLEIESAMSDFNFDPNVMRRELMLRFQHMRNRYERFHLIPQTIFKTIDAPPKIAQTPKDKKVDIILVDDTDEDIIDVTPKRNIPSKKVSTNKPTVQPHQTKFRQTTLPFIPTLPPTPLLVTPIQKKTTTPKSSSGLNNLPDNTAKSTKTAQIPAQKKGKSKKVAAQGDADSSDTGLLDDDDKYISESEILDDGEEYIIDSEILDEDILIEDDEIFDEYEDQDEPEEDIDETQIPPYEDIFKSATAKEAQVLDSDKDDVKLVKLLIHINKTLNATPGHAYILVKDKNIKYAGITTDPVHRKNIHNQQDSHRKAYEMILVLQNVPIGAAADFEPMLIHYLLKYRNCTIENKRGPTGATTFFTFALFDDKHPSHKILINGIKLLVDRALTRTSNYDLPCIGPNKKLHFNIPPNSSSDEELLTKLQNIHPHNQFSKKGCVYILTLNGSVIYGGRSMNPWTRLLQHRRKNKNVQMYIVMDNLTYSGTIDAEMIVIHYLQTFLNIQTVDDISYVNDDENQSRFENSAEGVPSSYYFNTVLSRNDSEEYSRTINAIKILIRNSLSTKHSRVTSSEQTRKYPLPCTSLNCPKIFLTGSWNCKTVNGPSCWSCNREKNRHRHTCTFVKANGQICNSNNSYLWFRGDDGRTICKNCNREKNRHRHTCTFVKANGQICNSNNSIEWYRGDDGRTICKNCNREKNRHRHTCKLVKPDGQICNSKNSCGWFRGDDGRPICERCNREKNRHRHTCTFVKPDGQICNSNNSHEWFCGDDGRPICENCRNEKNRHRHTCTFVKPDGQICNSNNSIHWYTGDHGCPICVNCRNESKRHSKRCTFVKEDGTICNSNNSIHWYTDDDGCPICERCRNESKRHSKRCTFVKEDGTICNSNDCIKWRRGDDGQPICANCRNQKRLYLHKCMNPKCGPKPGTGWYLYEQGYLCGKCDKRYNRGTLNMQINKIAK